jgi:hypothetical protein
MLKHKTFDITVHTCLYLHTTSVDSQVLKCKGEEAPRYRKMHIPRYIFECTYIFE